MAFLVVTLVTLTFGRLVRHVRELRNISEYSRRERRPLLRFMRALGPALLGLTSAVIAALTSEGFLVDLINAFTTNLSQASLFSYIVGLAALLVPSFVGVPVGIMLVQQKDPTDRLIAHLDPRDNNIRPILLTGLAIALTGAFIVAWLRPPPLPKAEVVWDKATWGENKKTKGDLLTQSGGFWYIFDDANQTLTAIPSGDVDTIYFSD